MFVRTIRLVLIIILLLVLVLVTLARIYVYNNLHYDDRRLQKTRRAKYREKQVKVPGGAELCYAEGPDNGIPLLLIHDNSTCWEDYDAVLPQLAKQYHVFAVDCFGHGGSAHLRRLYSCENNGDALLWFIQRVIGKPCLLSGHGTGGVIAAWMAANAPELVRGLVLEDAPFFRITPEELRAEESCLFWKDSCELLHDFLHQDREPDFAIYYAENSQLWNLYGATRDRVIDWVEEARRHQPGGPLRLKYIPYAHLKALYYLDRWDLACGEALYTGYWSQNLYQEELLGKLRCPVIYLKARDRYDRNGLLLSACSEQDVSKVQELTRGMELLSLKCGHCIHAEKPGKFLAAIDRLGVAAGRS